MVQVVIHANPALENQRWPAAAMQRGLQKHGVDCIVTGSRTLTGDVQIVQGPWYCLDHWQKRSGEHRVLYLDRCFYGRPDEDVSIGWLRPDGSRDFRNGGAAVPKGTLPRLKPSKEARRCAIVFADFGEDCTAKVQEARQRFDSVFFRPHPSQDRSTPVMTLRGDLCGVWGIGDVAIGHSSTVLVDAKINGLSVESTDPRHVVHDCGDDRESWLARLSWAQWSRDELEHGDWVEHLCIT